MGWSREVTTTFNLLKRVMTSAPVLALLDFNKPFIDKCIHDWGGSESNSYEKMALHRIHKQILAVKTTSNVSLRERNFVYPPCSY